MNYFQAVSTNSHGSSDSPVLDINGRAIALTAGGNFRKWVIFAPGTDRSGIKIPAKETSYHGGHCKPYSCIHLKRLGLPRDAESGCRKWNPG